MFRLKTAVASLLAGLILILSGCGYESVIRREEPTIISGDVLVVGDSIAGLVAALEAARNGASVMLFFEQPNEDLWLWNEGAVITEDPGNKKAVAALHDALAAFAEGRGKQWHHDILARRAIPDLEWLVRETGLELVQESEFRHIPDNLALSRVYERLIDAAMREGVRIFAGASILELLPTGDNAVGGVLVEASPGVSRQAFAPVVILADGGYLGDDTVLQALAPSVTVASWRRVYQSNSMRLAFDLGLDLAEEALFAYAPAVEENNAWVKAEWPEGALLIVNEQIIPLDDKTERDVVKELLRNSEQSALLLVSERRLPADHQLNWPVYAGIVEFTETYNLELPSLRRWFTQSHGNFLGRPVKAVAQYCLGGIAVDENGAALRDGQPVRGLYAVGEITGGLHGRNLMPGAALTEAVVWGRRVGAEAAKEARDY